ncbi:MAG: acyl carrier protein [Alphaproteobacteria bacterium]|nr:acyl carrier protein [Alphaproteobacteria bacterium]
MTESETYDALNGIFREVFDDEGISLTPETAASDIPEWDSFNHINILIASEIKFGVKFNASEVEGLKNVGDFVRLIQSKLAAG